MKSEAYLKMVSSGHLRRGTEHEKEKAKEEGPISEEQTSFCINDFWNSSEICLQNIL